MSLHHIYPNKCKKCHHRHISLAGTDHSNSKLSENISLKQTATQFSQYFRKSDRTSKCKCRILEELRLSFNIKSSGLGNCIACERKSIGLVNYIKSFVVKMLLQFLEFVIHQNLECGTIAGKSKFWTPKPRVFKYGETAFTPSYYMVKINNVIKFFDHTQTIFKILCHKANKKRSNLISSRTESEVLQLK